LQKSGLTAAAAEAQQRFLAVSCLFSDDFSLRLREVCFAKGRLLVEVPVLSQRYKLETPGQARSEGAGRRYSLMVQ